MELVTVEVKWTGSSTSELSDLSAKCSELMEFLEVALETFLKLLF